MKHYFVSYSYIDLVNNIDDFDANYRANDCQGPARNSIVILRKISDGRYLIRIRRTCVEYRTNKIINRQYYHALSTCPSYFTIRGRPKKKVKRI